MDDMMRLLRRLSRQGVPVESIARRLRGGFRLRDDERLLLLETFHDDGILLSYGEWEALRELIRQSAAPGEEICWFPYRGAQRLRVEPVMRVHRQN